MTASSQVPDRSIRVSFYDTDGVRVDNVTKEQAKTIAAANPNKIFYFQDKNGLQRELNIDQVLALTPSKDLISDTAFDNVSCPTEPQPCGPPKVQFFGSGGIGAMANAVISPVSSGVMAFDIVSPGKKYKAAPTAVLNDECGKGSGSSLKVRMKPSGEKDAISDEDLYEVDNVYVEAPGDGYLTNFDGSLGGNERTWKEADEGYVKTKEGNYYTVPGSDPPPNLGPDDEFIPPVIPVFIEDGFGVNDNPYPTYPVIVIIDDTVVEDHGFGYRPGDRATIIPDNGTVLEPVINDRGEVTKVNIITAGSGFDDLPEIIIESDTGFNAVIKPVLRVRRILDEKELLELPPGTKIISVVDCVGRVIQ